MITITSFSQKSTIRGVYDSFFLEAQLIVELHILVLTEEGDFGALTVPANPLQNLNDTLSKAFSSDRLTSNDILDLTDSSQGTLADEDGSKGYNSVGFFVDTDNVEVSLRRFAHLFEMKEKFVVVGYWCFCELL